MTDMAASVLARLQNKAKQTGRSYQLCLQLFCQEEFLRRVGLSKYCDNLILKGGLFIYTLTQFESRMKDYYDIYYLAGKSEFDGRKLYEAIKETFVNRERAYDDNAFGEVISFARQESMIKKWNAFVRKLKLPLISFDEVLNAINLFLNKIYNSIINENEFFGYWNPQEKCWVNHMSRN